MAARGTDTTWDLFILQVVPFCHWLHVAAGLSFRV